MIIHRRAELERIEPKKWALVYGRRKTGKTFIVENFIKYDEYYFVSRDRTITSKAEETAISYDVLVDRIKAGAKAGKTIVVDEFHRLGDAFLDTLQSIGHGGKLILVTSTLFLARRLINKNSPILGLFNEVQIPLISLGESLGAISKDKLANKNRVEAAIMLREPLAIDYYGPEKGTGEFMAAVLIGSVNTVPTLFGEILLEEDRGTSAIYEGIIRSVASGKVTSGEISSRLFSRRLIAKDDPSFVQSYLNTMVGIGLLRRIKVHDKNKFVYKVESPLMRLFFYADEKYGISQRRMGKDEAERIISEMLPHMVEDEVREHLAGKFGLEENVLEAKDYGVDGVLSKFKSAEIVLEVKWGKLNDRDTREIEVKMGNVHAKRKLLFVQNKMLVKSELLDVMDVSDL